MIQNMVYRKTIVMDYYQVLDLYVAACIGGACDFYGVCGISKDMDGIKCGNLACRKFLHEKFKEEYEFALISIPFSKKKRG
jgi:hypothetical protein